MSQSDLIASIGVSLLLSAFFLNLKKIMRTESNKRVPRGTFIK